MPTGYTAQLEEMKYDVKRWLKESVVRAFGICGELRDEGRMDQKFLMDFFKGVKYKESFSEQCLRETREELAQKMNWSMVAWENEHHKAVIKERDDYFRRVQEHKEKKAGHAVSIGKIANLYSKAVKTNQEELIVNSLKFALDQLNMVYDSDCGHEPYKPEILDQSPTEWKLSIIQNLHENIVRFSDRIAEEAEERTKYTSPATSYQKLVKFVDENCD